MRVIQVNRQTHFGGGEVFTEFLTKALHELGHESILIGEAAAEFWATRPKTASWSYVPTKSHKDAANVIQSLTADNTPTFILAHGPVQSAALGNPRPNVPRLAVCHMPVQGRNPEAYRHFDHVIPVSQWVSTGLRAADLPVWSEILYGIARVEETDQNTPIKRSSRFDWDERKVRDRLFGFLEPVIRPLFPERRFQKREGLTLGIVSRITPIKQFPTLIQTVLPTLQRHREINIEVFGAGGFDSIYDLWRVLQPIGDRVRWWGHQPQATVSKIYHSIDVLLAGLPEKEALGLNVIEAQACGTAVWAPAGGPFLETIEAEHGGWLYTDPRLDGGAGFEHLVKQFLKSDAWRTSKPSRNHLEKFSYPAFRSRVERLVSWITPYTQASRPKSQHP